MAHQPRQWQRAADPGDCWGWCAGSSGSSSPQRTVITWPMLGACRGLRAADAAQGGRICRRTFTVAVCRVASCAVGCECMWTPGELAMKRRCLFGLIAVVALGWWCCWAARSPSRSVQGAASRSLEPCRGHRERPDGTKSNLRANPKASSSAGDGHPLFQSSGEVPKLAANDRAKATPEEATVARPEVDRLRWADAVNEGEKTLSVRRTEARTETLLAAQQKWIVTSLTPEELKFTNPRTPAGVTRHGLEAGKGSMIPSRRLGSSVPRRVAGRRRLRAPIEPR